MYSFLKSKLYLGIYKFSVALIGSIKKISAENDSRQVASDKSYDRHFSTDSSKTEIIMPATRESVEKMIASDQVVIFSKTYCPYCKMAKEVFQSLNKKYTTYELDERDDADEIQAILGEMTGARTVPRVFVNNKCLGGGTDVKKLYNSGELQAQLQ